MFSDLLLIDPKKNIYRGYQLRLTGTENGYLVTRKWGRVMSTEDGFMLRGYRWGGVSENTFINQDKARLFFDKMKKAKFKKGYYESPQPLLEFSELYEQLALPFDMP